MSRSNRKDGFGVLGLGAAACVACCAPPLIVFLGGITVAGVVGTWFVGVAGLVLAAVAAAGFLVVRHRRSIASCAAGPTEPVVVTLSERRVAS